MILRLLGLVGLSAIILALGYWLNTLQQSLATPVPTQDQTLPDETYETVTLLHMDAQGRPRYRLKAPSLTRYAKAERAELARPKLTWYPETPEPPLELHAQTAVLYAAHEQIDLKGAVMIRRAVDANHPALEIATFDVSLWPKREFLRTAAPVVATVGVQHLEGIGLQADLGVRQLELMSAVRGRYVP